MNLDEEPLEEAAARTAKLFATIYRGLEERRVDPGSPRAALEARFAGTIADEGVGLLEALRETEELLPHCMGTPHPMYMGLINSSPLPAAALADLIVSSLNNNAGAFHQSPAFSAAEGEVVTAFARLAGMEGASGMLLPGGSFANLQALVLARAKHFPRYGEEPAKPVLYTSASSHFSVARSAFTAGLPASSVVAIPGPGRGALDIRALEARVAQDRREGRAPFCVVGTAGTTGTGAIDPLAALAALCEREKLWFHVDACYGGAALLLPELRERFLGIERADSLSIDPHKWFFIPLTAALLLTRHRALEEQTFETAAASYIPRQGPVDPFLRGFPTSRRSSGFTVWLALRAHGWSTIRDAVRRNVALSRRLERGLAQRGWEVLEGGELSVVCARPPREEPAAVANRLVASGRSWVAPVNHAGRVWLRFNIVNLHTRERHVDELLELLA